MGVSSEGESAETSWAGQLAEAQALEEGSDPSWAPQVTDVRADESEEMMEVGNAEDAEAVESRASYRDPTIPDLSDGEADEGAYFGPGDQYTTDGSITLAALQSAIESVATSESRDDAQAQGAAHTSDSAGILASAPADAQEGSSAGGPRPARENYLCVDGKAHVLLEDSVELRGADFPQSRGDSALQWRNLVLAVAASGFKCPVKPCNHKVAPCPGKSAKSSQNGTQRGTYCAFWRSLDSKTSTSIIGSSTIVPSPRLRK